MSLRPSGWPLPHALSTWCWANEKPEKSAFPQVGNGTRLASPHRRNKTGTASVSVLDFGSKALIEATLPDTACLASYVRQNATLRGNIYGLQDPSALAAIGAKFHLHPLVLEDILNNNQRQKVNTYENYLYIVLHCYEICTAPLNLVQDQISLFIGADYLLSFQERQSRTFEPVRQRLRTDRANLRSAATDMLAYSLFDSVVNSYFVLIESLDDYAERLEEEILGNPGPAVLENIHQFKRCVSQLRRNLYPIRELLGSLHREHALFLARRSNSIYVMYMTTPFTSSNHSMIFANWQPDCWTFT